jgi:hypothetical protein
MKLKPLSRVPPTRLGLTEDNAKARATAVSGSIARGISRFSFLLPLRFFSAFSRNGAEDRLTELRHHVYLRSEPCDIQ